MHHSFQEFVVDAADLYANQTKWVYLFLAPAETCHALNHIYPLFTAPPATWLRPIF